MVQRIVIGLLSLALGVIACTKNNYSTYPNKTVQGNSFVANGEGSRDEKFTAYNDTTSVAYDSSGRGVIVMSGASATSGVRFFLTIIKKTAATGSNQVLDQTYMILVLERNGESKSYTAITGSVTVNTWSNVGGRCSGSFSGSFALTDKPLNTVLQITAGYFYSVRIS